jgi:hypothetical protein
VQRPHKKIFKVLELFSAGIQSAGKWRRDLKPALFGEINSGVDVAFPARELHALNVLEHLALFQTFVFGRIFFVTVFARR